MERILSKDEISELLSAVRGGEIEPVAAPERPVEEKKVKGLDLVQQSRGAGRRRVGNLDILLDAFARNASISLTQRLQSSVLVRRLEIEPLQFDPLLLTLKDHGAIGIIRLSPLKHGGMLVFNGPLSYYFIETMLGGPAGPAASAKTFERPMTPIEVNVIKSVMQATCLDMQKAFRPLIVLDSSLVRIDVDPRLVNIVTPETEMMVVKFSVSADNESMGIITLAIPYPSLEPLRVKLKERVEEITSEGQTLWSDILAEVLPELEMEIIAQSGEVSMTIGKITKLQEGEIIHLDYDPDSPLRILVEGKPKFLALSGVHNNKKAVRITGRIN